MEFYEFTRFKSNDERSIFDRLPFNWKTPFGYLTLFLLTFFPLYSMTLCLIPIVCFASGSYYLISSFIRDITENDFPVLSENISSGNHMETTKQFCRFMQNFSEIKQLSYELAAHVHFKKRWNLTSTIISFRMIKAFNDIYLVLINYLFVWTLLVDSTSLFSLQHQIQVEYNYVQSNNIWLKYNHQFPNSPEQSEHTLNTLDLGVLFWATTFTCFACGKGEMLSNEFTALNDAFYHCDWHLLTPRIQRAFWMILAYTRQSVIIKGYANVSCTREHFKNVRHVMLIWLCSFLYTTQILCFRQWKRTIPSSWHFSKLMHRMLERKTKNKTMWRKIFIRICRQFWWFTRMACDTCTDRDVFN